MTEYEAQKLRESMFKELNVGPLAVWRCAAGLLIVIGVAVAGALFGLGPDRSSDVAQSQARPSVSRNDLDGQAYAKTQSPAEAVQNLVPVAGVGVQSGR